MKKEFKVNGMHCKSCETILSESIGEEQGVNKVTASTKEGKVTVDFDDKKITQDKIKSIIKKEGYEVA